MKKIVCDICGREMKSPDPHCLTVTGYDGLDICFSCEMDIIRFLRDMQSVKRKYPNAEYPYGIEMFVKKEE